MVVCCLGSLGMGMLEEIREWLLNERDICLGKCEGCWWWGCGRVG